MRRTIALLVLPLIAAFLAGFQEFQGLLLSTSFPSQVVPVGESVSLTLQVSNRGLPPQVARLEMRQSPRGWQAFFLGGGRVVNAVFVEPDQTQSVTLRLEPPDDIGEGTYNFVVAAVGDESESELPIEIVLGDVIPVQIGLEVDLPTLRGTPDTSFRYQATLRNDADQDLLVALEAEAPEGFQVFFERGAGGQEVTSLPVRANGSERLTVDVSPPDGVAAGEYPIMVRAVAGDATAELNLTADIVGRIDLNVTGQEGRLSGRVYSGEETPLTVIVQNNGSAPAQNIRMEASTPARWEVNFSPEVIEALQPGEQIEVTANIVPAERAVAGDYILTFRAVPEEGNRDSAEFRITLLTSTQWGVVGLVLIAAALGVVALAVSRFGRR